MLYQEKKIKSRQYVVSTGYRRRYYLPSQSVDTFACRYQNYDDVYHTVIMYRNDGVYRTYCRYQHEKGEFTFFSEKSQFFKFTRLIHSFIHTVFNQDSILHNTNLFIDPAFDLFILSFTKTEKIRRFYCVCSA